MDDKIKAVIKESYEKNARLRDRNEIVSWKVREMDKYLLYLKNENKEELLDIGCGAGQYAKYFKDRGLDVTCIDISSEMIEACKEKDLKAFVMDFYYLDFAGKQFDVVWAMNSLLHIPKNSINKIIKNIYSILKSDGLLYVGVYGGYNSEGIWEEDTYIPKRFFSFYDDNTIKSIFEEYFEIIDFEVVKQDNPDLHYQAIILRKKN